MPATVKGGLDLRKALRNFAPELAKETRKEMANALKPIVKEAKGYLPMQAPLSNWGREGGKFPVYNSSIAKRGIGYKTTPSKPNSQDLEHWFRFVICQHQEQSTKLLVARILLDHLSQSLVTLTLEGSL